MQVRHPVLGYRLFRAVIRLLLWLFYRRIEVVGRERVPEAGPAIIAANHHNSAPGPSGPRRSRSRSASPVATSDLRGAAPERAEGPCAR